MKIDLLASITVSIAVHVGAAVVVGGWLEKMPPGAPASTPGIEEVIIEFSAGDETAVDDSTVTAAPAQEQPQIATAPPEKSEEAPPAPAIVEAPKTVGAAQEAIGLPKTAEVAPLRDTPKKQAGNPAIKSRGIASRTSSGGGTATAEYRARASLSYPASALRDRAQGRVVLLVDVDENGRAASVTLKESSGRADLDHAAMNCARQSTYEPYRSSGVAQFSRVEAPFEFKAPRQ